MLLRGTQIYSYRYMEKIRYNMEVFYCFLFIAVAASHDCLVTMLVEESNGIIRTYITCSKRIKVLCKGS